MIAVLIILVLLIGAYFAHKLLVKAITSSINKDAAKRANRKFNE